MRVAWLMGLLAAAATIATVLACHQASTDEIEIVKVTAVRDTDGHVTVTTTLQCYLVGTVPTCAPSYCYQAAWVGGTEAGNPDFDASAAIDTVVACERQPLGVGDSVLLQALSPGVIPEDAGLTILVQGSGSDAGPFNQGGIAIPSP